VRLAVMVAYLIARLDHAVGGLRASPPNEGYVSAA
jgi:hypothetical protein